MENRYCLSLLKVKAIQMNWDAVYFDAFDALL